MPGAATPDALAVGFDPTALEPAQTLSVETGGTNVELLVWGERGRPGLFLLHGASAHAHWWDGVAPALAKTHRVAAMTLPGHGASDWRERYSSAAFCEDAKACVAAAGLATAGKPVFVGHSMGGAHLMHAAVHDPDAMRALVLVDTSFRSPRTGKPPAREKMRRVFATEAEALARFRLMPPGPAREPALVAHVARHAVMPVTDAGGATGWCWRADPDYWHKLERGIEQGPYPRPLRAQVPVVHLLAGHTHIAAAELPLGDNVRRLMLPDCGHHVMLDRPGVLVTTLCTLLAAWP